MGVMTLALSAFSIVPMAISFVHREFLSQVVTHMRREFKDDEENGGNFQGFIKIGQGVAKPTFEKRKTDTFSLFIYR